MAGFIENANPAYYRFHSMVFSNAAILLYGFVEYKF
jgi:hypothetical protein